MESGSRNNTLDAIRFVAIALIVYLHVYQAPINDPTKFETVPVAVARLAVPMFFIISGYMLYSPSRSKTKERAKKAAKKLFSLFVLSITLYTVFFLLVGSLKLSGATDVYNLVVFNLVDFSAGPLWFLLSLVYLNIIYLFVLKFFKNEDILIPVSVIVIASLLFILPYGTLNSINTEFTQHYFGKGWLYALPFFSLGYFLNKYQARYFDHFRTVDLVKCTLGLAIVYGVEYFLLSSFTPVQFGYVNYELYFFTAPLLLYLMLLALRFPNAGGALLAFLGRRISLYVYLIHTAIIELFVVAFGATGIADLNSTRLFAFFYLLVLVSSVFTALAYTRLKRLQV